MAKKKAAPKPKATPAAKAEGKRWFRVVREGTLALVADVEAASPTEAVALYDAKNGIVASETPASVKPIPGPGASLEDGDGVPG